MLECFLSALLNKSLKKLILQNRLKKVVYHVDKLSLSYLHPLLQFINMILLKICYPLFQPFFLLPFLSLILPHHLLIFFLIYPGYVPKTRHELKCGNCFKIGICSKIKTNIIEVVRTDSNNEAGWCYIFIFEFIIYKTQEKSWYGKNT